MPARVDIVGSDITEPFMVAPVVVIIDESPDCFPELVLHIIRQLVNFTFEAAMVSFNLAIGLRMIGRSYNMSYSYQPQVFAELPGKVPGAVIG
jgi:hypothetical protein